MNLQPNNTQHRITGKHYIKDPNRKRVKTGRINSRYYITLECSTPFCEGSLKVKRLSYGRGVNKNKHCKKCTMLRVTSFYGYHGYKSYMRLKKTVSSRAEIRRAVNKSIYTTV